MAECPPLGLHAGWIRRVLWRVSPHTAPDPPGPPLSIHPDPCPEARGRSWQWHGPLDGGGGRPGPTGDRHRAAGGDAAGGGGPLSVPACVLPGLVRPGDRAPGRRGRSRDLCAIVALDGAPEYFCQGGADPAAWWGLRRLRL